jgi:hypothetical protein
MEAEIFIETKVTIGGGESGSFGKNSESLKSQNRSFGNDYFEILNSNQIFT